jgi:hypothetical protein
MGTVQDHCVHGTNHAVEMVSQTGGRESVEFTSERYRRPLGLNACQNGELSAWVRSVSWH